MELIKEVRSYLSFLVRKVVNLMDEAPLPLQEPGGGEERCICNKLLCIIKGSTIEIKCNKCKRLFRIYTNGIVRTETTNGDEV